jgi:hypothetical protein
MGYDWYPRQQVRGGSGWENRPVFNLAQAALETMGKKENVMLSEGRNYLVKGDASVLDSGAGNPQPSKVFLPE